MIERFPYPECVAWKAHVPRSSVPDLFSTTDVLAQPSDEENFGSSVAEALACGVPVIVGKTNGTADYICSRSMQLVNDTPEAFANALLHFAQLKQSGELANGDRSRRTAEEMFDPARVAKRLENILYEAIA
jgi:glycosyltransferase involved in cell wall biosynthesis